MDSVMIAKIAAFVLYLGFMIYIGLRNANKNNSSSDFFLGGRKVGPGSRLSLQRLRILLHGF